MITFADEMRKLYFLFVILFVGMVISTFEYRHDYRKDINQEERDTGRIATIKLRSGHIIMYYNEIDTGYYTDAPECPLCIEKRLKDSIEKEERIKASMLAAKKKKDSLLIINNVKEYLERALANQSDSI